ncbi:MAG: hydroxyphenylacetyl-CoA thioesterase PaaI [Chitinophagia bacterium]|jgi:acyl-CoA thioesterase|nr:hydroxyphenylacetyl-CoA thioesterase PaaI [Chitinophagia bacterium]
MSANPVIENLSHHDPFSSWLGVKVISAEPGYSKITMPVREEMMNGFGIAHGGVTFSLADTAFGYASNGEGIITVALDTSISFSLPVYAGDLLTATARQLSNSRKTGVYLVEITNQHAQTVAIFKGTCYKTGKPHRTNTTGE